MGDGHEYDGETETHGTELLMPHVTFIDGCRVHGDAPMDARSYEAVRALIAAARARLAATESDEALQRKLDRDVATDPRVTAYLAEKGRL
jgi:hypothetical protein